jgi:hypothetical protein
MAREKRSAEGELPEKDDNLLFKIAAARERDAQNASIRAAFLDEKAKEKSSGVLRAK